MTRNRRRSARIEDPNETDVLITREYDAPIALVFDVLTKPEHVRRWGATPPDVMIECEIDLRVGGSYRSSFALEDGTIFTFSGTYLEVDPPVRTAETWLFSEWPDWPAIESWDLSESDGVTTVTMRLSFRDEAGHARMVQGRHAPGEDNGQQASFNAIEDILEELQR